MREAIQNLIQLQEIDKKLDALEQAKGDLPQIVRELEARLEEHQQELSRRQGELEDIRKQKRQAEREISRLTESKKKYEEQLYAVTTNKEYDAVTLEIEAAAQKIDELETEVLELIDKEEGLGQEVQELEQAINKLEDEHRKQSAELKEKIDANAKIEERLRAEREALVQKIRVDFLQRYEKIRGRKDGLAVVPIIRNSCGGCFTHIPPQRTMEVRDGDKIISCESCGRILFWQDEEESVNAA